MKVAGDRQSQGKGVLIVLNDRIGSARFISKTSNWTTDSFKSLEQGFLGDIVGGKVRFYQEPLTKHTYQTDFDIANLSTLPKVDILAESYGSNDLALLNAAIQSGAKGVVLGGWPASSADEKMGSLRGVLLVKSFYQATGQTLYEQDSFVESNSLNPQKARILLQLALTKTTDPKKIQQYFDEY